METLPKDIITTQKGRSSGSKIFSETSNGGLQQTFARSKILLPVPKRPRSFGAGVTLEYALLTSVSALGTQSAILVVAVVVRSGGTSDLEKEKKR